jgi:hypothetical protein
MRTQHAWAGRLCSRGRGIAGQRSSVAVSCTVTTSPLRADVRQGPSPAPVLNFVKVNGAVVTSRHRDGLAIADDGDPDTGVSVDDVSRQNGDLLQEVVESPGGELQLVPTLHQIGGLGLAVRGHAGRPCQRRAICVTEGSPPMSRVRSSSEATGTSSLA